jgi:phosphonate transport system substrate-binding protein
MVCRLLRFVTFLAPNLLPVYRFITAHVGRRLGCATELHVAASYADAAWADVAFLCGLPYVELTRHGLADLEPLAAPVLAGPRYAGRPVYFSDVIVRHASPYQSFVDLRGCTWCYNEPLSQSGYGITRDWLLRLGETGGFFGRVVKAGYHEQSIRMVCAGEADASAIDSQVLAVALRDRPALAGRLRVVATLGPSTIQPVVAARHLPGQLREQIRATLVGMAEEPEARETLARGLVERFVPVGAESYDDIRRMVRAAEEAAFLTIR